jgi:hypothetical protein
VNRIKRLCLIAFLFYPALLKTSEQKQQKITLKQVAIASSLGTASMLCAFKMIGKSPRCGYLASTVIIGATTVFNCLLHQFFTTVSCAQEAAKHHFYLTELRYPYFTPTSFTVTFMPSSIRVYLFTEEEKKAIETHPEIFDNSLENLRKNWRKNIRKIHSAAKEYASFVAWNEGNPAYIHGSIPKWPGKYESQCPLYTATYSHEYALATQSEKGNMDAAPIQENSMPREQEKTNQAKHNAETATR